jgi:hypothetical protein
MPNTTFPTFKYPLSGAVTQDLFDHWFSPTITYNFAGNAPIEKQVVENVASFGRQIGWLNEVVLALAGGIELPDETIKRMRDAAAEIERIKTIHAAGAYTNARDALTQLEQMAPARYRLLMDEFYARFVKEQPTARQIDADTSSSASLPPQGHKH